jgi:hypothetical protein
MIDVLCVGAGVTRYRLILCFCGYVVKLFHVIIIHFYIFVFVDLRVYESNQSTVSLYCFLLLVFMFFFLLTCFAMAVAIQLSRRCLSGSIGQVDGRTSLQL